MLAGGSVGKLILQVRRGNMLLGSWTLGAEPLELTLKDAETGADVALFTAQLPSGEEETFIRSSPRSSPHRPPSDDLTMPLPELTSETSALERVAEDDDLTMPLPDPMEEVEQPARGAEVWRRVGQSWQIAGRLPPGHQLTAFGGTVALRRRGAVIVTPGPSLSGSATLPDGQVQTIDPGSVARTLPAGVSIMLRSGEDGIYIRSETDEA
jgi:hypothetical protein